MSSHVRSMRRAATRTRQQEAFDGAMSAPLVFAGVLDDDHEAWQRGSVLFILPRIPERAHPDLANAVERRRRAVLGGICDCGARCEIRRKRAVVLHDADCSASDHNIAELLRLHRGAA